MKPIIIDNTPYIRQFKLSDDKTMLELIVQPSSSGNAYFWEYQGRHIQVAFVTTEGRLWLYAQGDVMAGRGPIAPRYAVYMAQAKELFKDDIMEGVVDTRMSKPVPICTIDEAMEQLEKHTEQLLELCRESASMSEFIPDEESYILHQLADIVRNPHPKYCPLHVEECRSGPTTWDEQRIVEHIVKGNFIDRSVAFDGIEYAQLMDKVEEIYARVRSELGE